MGKTQSGTDPDYPADTACLQPAGLSRLVRRVLVGLRKLERASARDKKCAFAGSSAAGRRLAH